MIDYKNKKYKNYFKDLGISDEAVEQRLNEIKKYYFYGNDDERVYYPVGDDMAYIMPFNIIFVASIILNMVNKPVKI